MRKSISGGLLASLIAVQLQAAEHDIEEIVVTGPFHEPVAESALPIGVLSGEALRKEVANSLGDTLDGQAGVQSSSFGPGVGQPVIRGQSGKRVQVLQNSVFVSDAANLSPDHGNGIEPLLADSIEVVRGPATLLYGSGAIGGVINVLDKRIPTRIFAKPELVIEQAHTSVSDENKTLVSGSASLGSFSFHADAYYRKNNDVDINGIAVDNEALEALEELSGIMHDEEEEDEDVPTAGYIENSSGKGEGQTFGVSWIGEDSFIGFSYNRFENEYGLPAGAHDHSHEEGHEEDHDDDHDEAHDEEHHEEEGDAFIRLALEQVRYDVKGDWHFDNSFISDARFHFGYTDYEHRELEFEPDGAVEVGTLFLNKGFDSRFSVTTQERGGWQGVWGLQMNDTDFSALGEEAFIPETAIRNSAVFVVERYEGDLYTVELGGRIERAELSPAACARDETVLSASASYIRDLQSSGSLMLTMGRSERAPTVEERYSNIATGGCGVNAELVTHAATNLIEIGNLDLETEVSTNFEVGYRLPVGAANIELSGFYNDISDYVYLAFTGANQDDVLIANYEGRDAEFYGLEATIDFPLAATDDFVVEGRVIADLVRGRFDTGVGADLNRNVPRISPARIGVELDWVSTNWTAGMRMTRVFQQGDNADYELQTPGYTSVSAYADYHWNYSRGDELTLFVKADNVLDAKIRNHVSFLKSVAPEPGRAFRLGVRYEY
jgi:iron complex outermembrane receptor protein